MLATCASSQVSIVHDVAIAALPCRLRSRPESLSSGPEDKQGCVKQGERRGQIDEVDTRVT